MDDNNIVKLGGKQLVDLTKIKTETASATYDFVLKNGEVHRCDGNLMLTGAFFACGVPLKDGSGVKFAFSAPLEQVDYVTVVE